MCVWLTVTQALHALHCYACPYLDALSGAAKPTTPTATGSGKNSCLLPGAHSFGANEGRNVGCGTVTTQSVRSANLLTGQTVVIYL